MQALRKPLVLLALAVLAQPALARQPGGDLFLEAISLSEPSPGADAPIRTNLFEKSRRDTVCYGGHDGNGYAVQGGVWDFNDGTMQGWYGVDLTQNTGDPWFRRVAAADFECPESAPMIKGTAGQIWIGGQQMIADEGCWVCDAGQECSLGYPNNLRQRMDSPPLSYSGGDVILEFLYFFDAEGWGFDYAEAQLVAMEGLTELDVVTFDIIGDLLEGPVGSPENPAFFSDTLLSSELPVGMDGMRIRFRFTSDSGWSDEDAGGGVCSTYGPFGADSVVVSETVVGELASYDFDEDDEGWIPSHIRGTGVFVGVNPASLYDFPEDCDCQKLRGHVLSFHDENLEHPGDPTPQNNLAVSPIVDRTALPDQNVLFARYDVYGDLPLNDGVLYRPGWFYYPWTCEASGHSGWSPRMGRDVYFYIQPPVCETRLDNAVHEAIPHDADLYRFALEVLSCCSCFGIEDCTGESNATPLFDNIQICFTSAPDVPVLSFANDVTYQDGFSQGFSVDPREPGRSDVWSVSVGSGPPFILDDSLAVVGPVVGGHIPSWEARLWFRVSRKGPEIFEGDFDTWKARFSGAPETDFVSALMDSVQLGSVAFRNKFCSYFHESDPGFNPSFPEFSDENEILPDDLFTPGTMIDYFVTGNWVGSSEYFHLPDTTGGGYLEFEILPRLLRVGSFTLNWPCFLYIDAYNGGAQPFIESGLNQVLPELPGDLPKFDRYDMPGATTNYNGNSIYRLGVGADNGAALAQLLAYRTILVSTGPLGVGTMEEADVIGLEDWLLTTICGFSLCRQGLILNGESIASIAEELRPGFLSDWAGAAFECAPYREEDCPAGTPEDTSYCVQLVDSPDGAYETQGDLYAFGNACPQELDFSVLLPVLGVGNKSWLDYDARGTKGTVDFAQVVFEKLDLHNYRTVVDGFSYHHLTDSFDGSTCSGDTAGIAGAIASEIHAALQWIHDGSLPFCDYLPCKSGDGPCGSVDVPEDVVVMEVNRLYPVRPNPFHPRGTILFSLSGKSSVEVSIFDASGRRVRELLREERDAGLHQVLWDLTDDQGHRVASGVYWVQMRTPDYVSSKRLLLLK
jgi:hypothetical protein